MEGEWGQRCWDNRGRENVRYSLWNLQRLLRVKMKVSPSKGGPSRCNRC